MTLEEIKKLIAAFLYSVGEDAVEVMTWYDSPTAA
jgi:hypothetical protein